jgi:hypothetical protein
LNNLTVTEFKDIRVLTTQQLADQYETDSKTVSNNFNRNKDRYQEGKHFILLQGEELKDFKTNHQFDESSRVNQLYLWTEKGCLLHAKSLNTDKAWESYDDLVENYFKARDILAGLTTEMQGLIMHDKKLQLIVNHIEKSDQKIAEVDNDLQDFKQDMPLLGLECDRIVTAVKAKGVNCLGGKDSAAYNERSLRTRVYQDIHHQLKREFGVSTYKAIKRSQTDLAIQKINEYHLPVVLEEEVINTNNQLDIDDIA